MAYRKIINDRIAKISLIQDAKKSILVVLGGVDDGIYLPLGVIFEDAKIDPKKVSIESILTDMLRENLINKTGNGAFIGLTKKGKDQASKVSKSNFKEEV